MRSVIFTVPGRIGGKGRHRSFIRGGKIATATPGKTASQEGLVRHFAAEAMRKAKVSQLIGPLRLSINATHQYPKSWSSNRCKAVGWVTGKPDGDNIVKLISDAMNHIMYRDDSQIASLHYMRRYSSEPEAVHIEIAELEAP